jgi:hypothetical protein
VLWFTVWTVLVLATLVGAFWLGRDLWRKGKALFAELQQLGDLVGQMADQADRLTAQAQPEPIRHHVLDAPERHRLHLDAVHGQRAARRDERREARYAMIHARWREYTR